MSVINFTKALCNENGHNVKEEYLKTITAKLVNNVCSCQERKALRGHNFDQLRVVLSDSGLVITH